MLEPLVQLQEIISLTIKVIGLNRTTPAQYITEHVI